MALEQRQNEVIYLEQVNCVQTDLISVIFKVVRYQQSAICRLQRRGRPVGLSTAGARREKWRGAMGSTSCIGTGMILSGRLAPEILA